MQLGGPYIPLKTGRRDGRKSRAEVVEQYLPDNNESISVFLDRFGAMGIDTPGVVALLGMSLLHHAFVINSHKHTHIHHIHISYMLTFTIIYMTSWMQ